MSEQNERYARADVHGGYLYNKSEIDYFKQTQALDVVSNLMLGDFNKKGLYMINEEVIKELVKLKKVYQYSFGSTTFCQSMNDVGGYGKIDFAIKIRSNNQNGITTATLQLLETIDRANGYYQNTNTASIATYSAKESNSFIVDMLKYFNVVSKKDEGLLRKDKNEEDVDLIIARKKYEDLLKKGSEEKIDLAFKSLYEKRLKILAKSAVGKKILAELNSETYKINGWFVKEGMPGYYKYLNQVLDGLYEVHSEEALQDVALTAAWRKTAEVASADMAKILSNVDRAIAEVKNEDIAKQQANARQNTMGVEEKPKDEAQKQQAQQPKQEQPNKSKQPKVAVEVEKPVEFEQRTEVEKSIQEKPTHEKVVDQNKQSLLGGLSSLNGKDVLNDMQKHVQEQENKQNLAEQLGKISESTEEEDFGLNK